MKNAYVQLKGGYNTATQCDFMTEEDGFLRLWGEKGMVGIFILDQVEFCVITEKHGGKK